MTAKRFDAKAKLRFLKACTRLGSIQQACKYVRFAEPTVRKHMKMNARFEKKVREALAATKVRPNLKFDARGKRAFLEAYEAHAGKSLAAQAAGVGLECVNSHIKNDSEFAEKVEAALERFRDRLEIEAHRRATEGVNEPVFHMGLVCGGKQKYSDSLMALLLKRHRKDEYSDKAIVDVNHTGGVLVTPGRAQTDEEWEKAHSGAEGGEENE